MYVKQSLQSADVVARCRSQTSRQDWRRPGWLGLSSERLHDTSDGCTAVIAHALSVKNAYTRRPFIQRPCTIIKAYTESTCSFTDSWLVMMTLLVMVVHSLWSCALMLHRRLYFRKVQWVQAPNPSPLPRGLENRFLWTEFLFFLWERKSEISPLKVKLACCRLKARNFSITLHRPIHTTASHSQCSLCDDNSHNSAVAEPRILLDST